MGRQKKIKGDLFSKKKTRKSHHQHLFRGNVRKPKRMSAYFEKKEFGSCLRIGKVLAPHVLVIENENL